MFYEVAEDHILLRIKAVPGSSINKIADIQEGVLRIKIKAPAVEGAANKELIKFLSKTLRIAKSDIDILKGETSKIKSIRVPIDENIVQKLATLVPE
jgi:uncharacterized protein (TIGR00251 family)